MQTIRVPGGTDASLSLSMTREHKKDAHKAYPNTKPRHSKGFQQKNTVTHYGNPPTHYGNPPTHYGTSVTHYGNPPTHYDTTRSTFSHRITDNIARIKDTAQAG